MRWHRTQPGKSGRTSAICRRGAGTRDPQAKRRKPERKKTSALGHHLLVDSKRRNGWRYLNTHPQTPETEGGQGAHTWAWRVGVGVGVGVGERGCPGMDGDGPLGCSVDATCAVWNGWATGAAGTARGNVCEWVPWRTKTPGRNIGHQLDFNRKNRPPTQSRRSHCIADRRRIEDTRPAPSAAGSKPESVPCAERGYPPRLQVSASDLTGPSRAWGATVRPPPHPSPPAFANNETQTILPAGFSKLWFR